MSHRLDALRRQHNDIRDGINVIESKATTAGRDLTDAEQTDVDALYARAEQLLPDIEKEAAKQQSMDAAASVLARVAPAQLQTRSTKIETPPETMTAGEWMVLHYRSKKGDQEATELLTRAVAGQTTADTPGILPIPIIGPLMSFTDNTRPVWNSFTPRPMPGSGKVFIRPRITQHVNVAEQAAELDELVSRKMTIAGDNVTKRTFGGVLELSEQDVDWTDPAAMQLVIQDFVDVFAAVEESVAVAALLTLAAAPTSPWTSTNIGTMISSITTAIGTVYTDSKKQADTLWLSLDAALTLAGVSNATTNVSAMSLIKQALNDAGMPLNIVVGPQLPANTRIVGASSLVERYEQIKGLITAPDVSHLGVVMAYRGYVATFGYASGFVAMV
jgi:HK97 family phage major capsid protein